MNLKSQLHSFGTKSSAAQRVAIIKTRNQLSQRLALHFKQLSALAPTLQTEIESVPEAEQQNLYFPSSFSQEERDRWGIIRLAETEGQLRVGQAWDALRQIMELAATKAKLLIHQKRDVRGTAQLNRSIGRITGTEKAIQKWSSVYRVAWTAIESLKVSIGPGSKAGHLRELTSDDIKGLVQWLTGSSPGRVNSWIWQAASEWCDSRDADAAPGLIENNRAEMDDEWNNECERRDHRSV